MADYGLLDRIVHRAALQFAPVAEMSFDIDQRGVEVTDDLPHRAHVFVSGLARAGTTILMRRLYATGAFCSLTYRHMPFVLAPNTLGRMMGGSGDAQSLSERAHGDRIRVNVDSPESLDEVYWRVFDGDSYIRPDHLLPHAPDREAAESYVAYIAAILKADALGRARYLSKNNNNILRLRAIAGALPGAVILVPFRDPLAHAASLMRQHANFLDQQGKDGFVRSYMTWLGHHEFGLDHRPFRFSAEGAAALDALEPGTLDYWLEIWCQAHEWLDTTAPDCARFVPYEDLCSDPAVWAGIARLCGVDAGGTDEPFEIAPPPAEIPQVGRNRLDRARALHARLRSRVSSALSAG